VVFPDPVSAIIIVQENFSTLYNIYYSIQLIFLITIFIYRQRIPTNIFMTKKCRIILLFFKCEFIHILILYVLSILLAHLIRKILLNFLIYNIIKINKESSIINKKYNTQGVSLIK
jgi:hypothetical protein